MVNLSKKKKIVIIASVVVLLAVAAVVFFVFFNNNLVGAWTTKEGDVETVLTFSDGGKSSIQSDSIKVDGTYEVNGDKVKINIVLGSNEIINKEYKYQVMFGFNEKTLKLTDPDGKTTDYTLGTPKELEPPSDFTAKESILGIWENKAGGFEYEFTEKGIAVFRKSNMTITLTYTVDDDNVYFNQMVSGQERKNTLKYTVNEKTLTMNGTEFIKKG